MSPSSEAPTPRQLRYLRALAEKTGTTFTYPSTRAQASREIDRLSRRPREPRDSRARDHVEDHQGVYATAVQVEEVAGFGASATWRVSPPAPARRNDPLELARYTVRGRERVLNAVRRGGRMRIIDCPCAPEGRSYLVERDAVGERAGELRALVADYLEQARLLDDVPMAAGAVRQLLGEVEQGV